MGIATKGLRIPTGALEQPGVEQKPPLETPGARSAWIWPVGLTATALLLRLYHLGAQSLWIDEGYSISNTLKPDPTAWAQDVRPLYYVFLRVWLHLGHSEFILRLPSAVFGAAAVLMVYMLGRKLIGERGSRLAAALMMISPLHVNHSQEVRMYSLLTLLTLIATYELVLLLETRRIKHLLLYLVASLSSIATFPLSASLLLAQDAAAFFGVSRRELRRWVMAEALFVLPCVPLFVYALHNLRYLAPETSTYPSPLGVIEIIGTFSLSATGPTGSTTWYAFYAYTICSLALIGFGIAQVRRSWNGHTWRHVLLLLWLVIPLVVTAELVRISGAQWLPRYVIYASPAYFLLLGLSVNTVRDRRIQCLAAIAILAFPALRLIRYYERPSRPQWREAVQFVQRNERPGDVIAIYRPGNGAVFAYYYRGKQPWLEIGQPKLQKRAPWTEKRTASTVGDLKMRYRRVWLVMSQYDPAAGDAIKRHVRKTCRVLCERSYAEIEMLLYERRGIMVGPPGFEPGTSRL